MLLGSTPEKFQTTNMHVDHLSIAFLSTDSRCNHHQSVLGDKVSYTSFVFCAVPRVRLEVKLQSPGKRKDGNAVQDCEDAL